MSGNNVKGWRSLGYFKHISVTVHFDLTSAQSV